MLLLALVAISLIKSSQCVKAIPGQPVPNADVLSDLLSKFLGDSYSNNALVDFILGQPSQYRDNLSGDNLDISILDVNNVQKIIAFAKKKHENNAQKIYAFAKKKHENGTMAAEKTRRLHNELHKKEFYVWNENVVNKSLELMKHSMYITKEKIGLTRPFRKRYSSQPGYQIAILYGASTTLLFKMETLFNRIESARLKTHFIYHLIIYEKILACNVEISDSVEKLFLVYSAFAQEMGGIEKPKMSREEINKMMNDPNAAAKNKDLLLMYQKRFQTK